MRPKRYSSEAIVLARRNFSEADRILTVFSKHYGKIVLLAKGVRKPKSRKRGSIEIFSIFKFSSARGKVFDIVTEVEIIDSFNIIRDDLKKVSLAYFFMEVVDRITQEGEKSTQMYKFINSFMEELISSKNLRKLKNEFIKEILTISGFWPENRQIENPTKTLEYVLERKISSARVGKKVLS